VFGVRRITKSRSGALFAAFSIHILKAYQHRKARYIPHMD
jgi:hypothetical protein